MHGEPLVEVRRDGPVAVIGLRRERKLNALSTELELQLHAALADERVAGSACVVITGGATVFSAGADINEFRDRDPASILASYRATGDLNDRIAALRQPTVCAICGWCLGGGLELALATDIRVADPEAVFGLPEVAIGIVPSSGGILRLTRAVGPARARELVLRARRFDAAEALACGVVHELAEGALPRALEIAHELAALPAVALDVAKQAVDAAAESSREATLLVERLAYAMLAQTADAQEATEAFLGKRPPRFSGR